MGSTKIFYISEWPGRNLCFCAFIFFKDGDPAFYNDDVNVFHGAPPLVILSDQKSYLISEHLQVPLFFYVCVQAK